TGGGWVASRGARSEGGAVDDLAAGAGAEGGQQAAGRGGGRVAEETDRAVAEHEVGTPRVTAPVSVPPCLVIQTGGGRRGEGRGRRQLAVERVVTRAVRREEGVPAPRRSQQGQREVRAEQRCEERGVSRPAGVGVGKLPKEDRGGGAVGDGEDVDRGGAEHN